MKMLKKQTNFQHIKVKAIFNKIQINKIFYNKFKPVIMIFIVENL